MYRPRQQIGVGDVQISALTRKYISQVLDSRRITYGPFTRKFEQSIAKSHGVKYAIFCNSGTSALQVAVHALKKKGNWKNGDEVIVPAITFVATVNVILQNNLQPIFVDIDPDYYMLDPAKLTAKISSRTKAIIPVHIGGQPADMQPIMAIAHKHNLRVIEDACETMFSKYQGQVVGSFGDFSCFSTYAAHTLVTGVGGFICTNDPNLAVLAKSLVNHGRDGIYIAIDDDRGKKSAELFNIVDRRFKFIDVGYSYRATEFEGALGLAQMSQVSSALHKRRTNAAYLSRGLADLQKFLQLPKTRPGSEHNFMFYPLVIIDKLIKRDELVMFLEQNLIETRYLLPLLNQPVYQKMFGNIAKQYPVAQKVADNGFYIASHPGLHQKDLKYIVYKFHEFFKNKQLI